MASAKKIVLLHNKRASNHEEIIYNYYTDLQYIYA